jgi:hypothetical protein
MRRRDDLAIHNERVKLFVTVSNAVGLAFFGLGFARPLADGAVPITPMIAVHLTVAVAAAAAAYIALGQLKTDDATNRETDR